MLCVMAERVRDSSPTKVMNQVDTEGMDVLIVFNQLLLVTKNLIIKHVIRMNLVTVI